MSTKGQRPKDSISTVMMFDLLYGRRIKLMIKVNSQGAGSRAQATEATVLRNGKYQVAHFE